MTTSERHDYARTALASVIENSQISIFVLTLGELSRKLDVKSTGLEINFQINVNKKKAEEEGVKSNICKALFGSKSFRNLHVMISPSALVIEAYNDEKSTDKKASLILNAVDEGHLRKSLFVADGKRNGRTILAPKYINIESSDCVALVRTVKTNAEQQGIIKQ
jgi:hypothetical protein